jgi:hypothetical protein
VRPPYDRWVAAALVVLAVAALAYALWAERRDLIARGIREPATQAWRRLFGRDHPDPKDHP